MSAAGNQVMKEKSILRSEIADVKTQLDRINTRLDALLTIVNRMASGSSASRLETLSATPLEAIAERRLHLGEALPDWSHRTLTAVRGLCQKGNPATAAMVAAITGKRRNTESARLVFLSSLGLLRRKRNGRNVLYLYGE